MGGRASREPVLRGSLPRLAVQAAVFRKAEGAGNGTKRREIRRESGEKDWERRYDHNDIETLLRREDWKSWDEVIAWVERYGEQDKALTPGEALAIRDGLVRLKASGAEFTRDPDRLFHMLRDESTRSR